MNDRFTVARRCEEAVFPDRAIDYDIADITGTHFERRGMAPPFTSDFEVAKALVPDGWSTIIDETHPKIAIFVTLQPPHGFVDQNRDHIYARGATVELALCAAAMRAQAVVEDVS